MNPLTLVKRIQSINSKEAALGISEEASWHSKYKDSAYVFAGGIPFDLTEGDLLAVFAQYGEIVDVNLVRDKGTGKSKGFAFIAYEDQRSTILAVDNLNGAQILGRTIRVDHVADYKKKEEEDEETEQRKKEARGVCRAFQRGECTRGAGCKFSHDERRAANTGWGSEDKSSQWGHEKFEGSRNRDKRSGNIPYDRVPEATVQEGIRSGDKASNSKAKGGGMALGNYHKQSDRTEERRSRRHDDELKLKDHGREEEKRLKQHDDEEYEPKSREDSFERQEKRLGHDGDEHGARRGEEYYRREEKRLRRKGDDESEPKSREDYDWREEKRMRRQEPESYMREGQDNRGNKWSSHYRDSSTYHRNERDDYRHRSDR